MGGLLNVGEMGALALHVMVELALVRREEEEKEDGESKKGRDSRRTAQELALGLDASVHTLQKVIRRLVLAGLLDGVRGANGGVKLTDEGAAASMLRVIESVEGPVRANGCLFAKRVCLEGKQCRFHAVTGVMEKSIRDYFSKTTINDWSV